jgi:hypothetical protein
MRSYLLKYKLLLLGIFMLVGTGCALDDTSDPEGGPSEDVSVVESALVSCSGPSTMYGYYANGRRYTYAVTVSCTPAVSRLRVWGELRIFGVLKDSKDVTCWNTTSCTMPEMSAVAGQYDTWTSQYWYNWTN